MHVHSEKRSIVNIYKNTKTPLLIQFSFLFMLLLNNMIPLTFICIVNYDNIYVFNNAMETTLFYFVKVIIAYI